MDDHEPEQKSAKQKPERLPQDYFSMREIELTVEISKLIKESALLKLVKVGQKQVAHDNREA